MTVGHLDKLKAKFGLPGHVELVPTGDDEVRVHRPGYCALYAYPFTIVYSLPFPLLIEEFCHHYNVCLA